MAFPDEHPTYGRVLGGEPRTVEGVIFRPYRAGLGRYVRVSDDFRIEVYQRPGADTFRAIADGRALPTRFRSERTAVRSALSCLHERLAP